MTSPIDTIERAARQRLRPARVDIAFAMLSFSSIFLQKFGLAVVGGSIGLDAFILWGVLLWLFVVGRAVIDIYRASLFMAMLFFIVVSMLVGGEIKSVPALIVLVFMYGTLLFQVEADEALVLRCLASFQAGMKCIAWIVLAQQLLQYTVGNAYWPNIDRTLPSFFLVDGYAYIRPYSWNSPYLTPNGVFFLEPSAASGFLALSVVVEVIWFRRLRRLGLLVLSVLACMAGSGPTMLALFSPLILLKMDRKLIKWSLGLGVPLLLIALTSGFLNHFLDRSSEFSNDNSSAYARIVVPLESTLALAANPQFMIAGNGAGSSPKGKDQVQWPANKLIFEYGLLTALIFHAFLLVAVLGSPISRTLALVVLVPHLFFGGGFVSHTNIMMLVMFGSLLRLRRTPARTEHLEVQSQPGPREPLQT